MEKKLAIIIPAFKPDFLELTLNSIANQNCKLFNLYVGDDGSPYDLYEIFRKFSDNANFNYYKFDDNLGRVSLVAHWERCIELSKEEEWIWLFSDDDLMSENCITEFYKYLDAGGNSIMKFALETIDAEGKNIIRRKLHYKYLSAADFLEGRFGGYLKSFVVEYVFPRRDYLDVGGFCDLPLAWHSDDFLWYNLAKEKGIIIINEATVFWRMSSSNITPMKNRNILESKLKATQMYFEKLHKNIDPVEFKRLSNTFFRSYILTNLASYLSIFSFQELNKYYIQICGSARIKPDSFYLGIYWYSLKFKFKEWLLKLIHILK